MISYLKDLAAIVNNSFCFYWMWRSFVCKFCIELAILKVVFSYIKYSSFAQSNRVCSSEMHFFTLANLHSPKVFFTTHSCSSVVLSSSLRRFTPTKLSFTTFTGFFSFFLTLNQVGGITLPSNKLNQTIRLLTNKLFKIMQKRKTRET